jgi:SAM-dependent methyltransferase
MSDQLPLLVRHLLGFYAMETLAMGRASGALAALTASPGSVDDVAARAGIDRRNTEQWLRAMAAAGHAHHDHGVFALDDETEMVLGPGFPIDFGAVLDFVHAVSGASVHAATEAMRTGTGVPSEEYAELGAAAGGANTRIYRNALVDEWIGAAPRLRERLESGGRIADLACGNADAAAVMAEAFPQSRVLGFDPGTPEGVHAEVANLEIVRDTAGALPMDAGFDLVTCLDALHHLGDPGAAADHVHGSLRDGGVFLVAEGRLTGDVETDNLDPFSLIAHAAGLMYCLQENLANGGTGTTPSIGLGWVDDALVGAGFSSIEHHDSETGYRVFLATR